MSEVEQEMDKESQLLAAQTVWELAQGNKRHITSRSASGRPNMFPNARDWEYDRPDLLSEDPMRPAASKAVVLSCARSYAPVDTVFDTSPGEL